ncbi:MAG: hypothetical protein A3D67_02550 [Candidatus Lloydbacteria bacterium RIFCSPHIGHO2_02_FULL_51_22]|uniref:VWFA domain-containing protein n=2 Tax=Candidatus Lloydiibacteriota TaxID=1817910 RepID=A0A1G2D9M5_9BACT|nr:MAG: hypothetical protein A3D67_02550 [Candidatus Lloydbacteria bacterium RIFCSPHIGHO2_02_FULL_51_22]OGZ14775.1 MAG: hypothetical protein A3J08_04345 [Candidatus Lloydbacteria bacterium RIFCSPLOWO2_02_FULL_51_11]
MPNDTTNGVGALFQSAVDAGALSTEALKGIGNIRDIGEEINNALGIKVDGVTATEVILVTLLVDDSGSIRFIQGNTEAVREGHNFVLDSLGKTKTQDGILAMCAYLNQGLLYPYSPVDKAVRMDTSNYNPNGGTPLYNEAVKTLATVIAKCQEFLDNGIACRTVTAIITDGANSYPGGKTAADVKKIVADMLKSENHIIAGMGIADGSTNFKAVFEEMGIHPEWILTPKNSPSEIRRAFNMLSQSAQRASQASGVPFSKTAMGGFASP